MKKSIYAVMALACVLMAVACNSKNKKISWGDEAQMDSLSYCIGANIGFGISDDMSDVPFNIEQVKKGIKEAALEKASQTQDEAIDILRDYFMTKRNARKAECEAVLEENPTATVDYSGMFLTEEECNDVSYAFGNDLGSNIRNGKFTLQIYWLTKGFGDAYEGYSEIGSDKVQTYLNNFVMVVFPAQMAEKSEKWLESMAKGFGVKKTESGLLYKVVRAGDLSTAATDDRDVVVVKYEGKNIEGTVFDSSYERVKSIKDAIKEVKNNKELTKEERDERIEQLKEQIEQVETIEFPLNRVIRGWTEGMKLIGKGGKIRLYIPSDLAYGPRGAGRDIGPNEALEFVVELVDVKPYVDPTPVEEPAAEAETTVAE